MCWGGGVVVKERRHKDEVVKEGSKRDVLTLKEEIFLKSDKLF